MDETANGGVDEHIAGASPAARPLLEELAAYVTGKGTVQFPLDRPLPADLIRRMVEFRSQEVYAKPGK